MWVIIQAMDQRILSVWVMDKKNNVTQQYLRVVHPRDTLSYIRKQIERRHLTTNIRFVYAGFDLLDNCRIGHTNGLEIQAFLNETDTSASKQYLLLLPRSKANHVDTAYVHTHTGDKLRTFKDVQQTIAKEKN